MKKLCLLGLMVLLSFTGFSQTLSSYGFNAFSAPYDTVAGSFIT